jgi:hypothetical protein
VAALAYSVYSRCGSVCDEREHPPFGGRRIASRAYPAMPVSPFSRAK